MKIMLIDGNSIINRAFFGVRLLSTKDGIFTNALYGFLGTYFKLFAEENPDKVIVCFDVRAKTFRHKDYPEYKAARSPMPEELKLQMPILKELLDAMAISRCELEGYEADDIIGTFSRVCDENDDDCVVVTGDKDALQLISNKTTVKLVSSKLGKTTYTNYTPDYFKEIYGFEPIKMIDLKAFMGDKSDNIPGVAGIGEKTATNLLLDFKSFSGVYENIEDDRIKKGVREKLKAEKDIAKKSFWLATIDKNVPINMPRDNVEIDTENLTSLLEKLEFKNFLGKFNLKVEKNELSPIISKVISNDSDLNNIYTLIQKTEHIFIIFTDNFQTFAILLDNISYVLTGFNETSYKTFTEFLFSGKHNIICHDSKKIFENMQNPKGISYDIFLAAYLLDPSANNYSIDVLSAKYLDLEISPSIFNNENAFSSLGDFDETIKNITSYLQVLSLLYPIISEKIKLEGMESLLLDIEMKLVLVLADMEKTGFLVDRNMLLEFSKTLGTRIDELTLLIHSLASEEFNINSPKVLGTILFEKLGITGGKKTKTGYSTNIEILEFVKNQHEIIPLIIEYRSITKLKSTYADGLSKVISHDGRIHSSFNQTVAATGRLSSTDPNLQNIPTRTELGSLIRKMFIASPCKVLVLADYSQIELRILADISNDTAMQEAFLSGEDVHTVTASRVFNVSINDVTKQMRASAKAVNFGIVYGIGEFSLANDIGVSRVQAAEYIKTYLEKYNGVRDFMDNIKIFAKNHGYVETTFGRRRYIPDINSSNFNIRSSAERIALNTPIQGSAADIIKIAMINVYEKIKNLDAKIILQVHDELIIECAENIAENIAEILSFEMENAYKSKIPLIATSSIAINWFDAK